MNPTIRAASTSDAAAVAGIYGPFCDSTPVSFEYAAPSTEEMASRIQAIGVQFPWLVLDDSGVVTGYAYAARHSERAAYGWSTNTAVYVSSAHHRRGVARALYTTLFELLRLQGYFKAYAGITLPNDASRGLHNALGFTLVGVYEGVGYKQGAWHDVAWYQAELQPERANPDPPVLVSALVESPRWTEAMSKGLKHYHPRPARDIE